jgi:hypothetical protein
MVRQELLVPLLRTAVALPPRATRLRSVLLALVLILVLMRRSVVAAGPGPSTCSPGVGSFRWASPALRRRASPWRGFLVGRGRLAHEQRQRYSYDVCPHNKITRITSDRGEALGVPYYVLCRHALGRRQGQIRSSIPGAAKSVATVRHMDKR